MGGRSKERREESKEIWLREETRVEESKERRGGGGRVFVEGEKREKMSREQAMSMEKIVEKRNRVVFCFVLIVV